MKKVKNKKNGQRDFSIKSTNSLTGKGRIRDSVFQRDNTAYDSQRAERRQVTWFEKHARSVWFVIGFIAGWFIGWLLISGIGAVLAKLLASASAQYGWHAYDAWFATIRAHGSVFVGTLAYTIWKPWLVIPASALGVTMMVSIGNQAAKTVAKLDDSALLTDVNDSWIWSVPEMIEHYAVIADRGMHTKSAPVSSLVGHIYLKNHGLKSLNMAKHDKVGNIIKDEEGNIVREKVPMIDNRNLRQVLDIQGLSELDPKDILVDATQYDYDKTKDGRIRTLAEAINEDWYMPDYELLRPMGAYFIETNSIHTLILSMTRGNKTQLTTLATVDAWRRDNTLWNLVVNDPKGEMQMASYQLLQKAGYDVVPFSLTHPDKAVRYNPLQMVIEDIRRGKMPAASTELSNLSSTFFPSTGGDDFWISTARSVFQMMTYQLMNYMIDEERKTIRLYQAKQSNRQLVDQMESLGDKERPNFRTQEDLDRYIDDLWGKVSMNSMYQMIAQLDVIKMPDAIVAAGDTKYAESVGDDEEAADPETPEEVSGLDVLASAIRELPDNAIRRNFKGPDTMLRKASGSDATTGSIYATALQNMSFFVQETIKKLTTVSPKNGLNILDFPFPRRFSVRLNPLIMQRMRLGRRKFTAALYKDPMFKKPYGDKKHDTIDDGAVESSGWIDFWFKKIPRPRTGQFYIKIEIWDVNEENIVLTLYFAINKGYLLDEQGRNYVKDPITGQRIIKDGTAFEVKPMDLNRAKALYKAGKALKMTQRHDGFVLTRKFRSQGEVTEEPIVAQTMFNYTEKPRALFLSIPPQIEEQAKLALVLIDSIFNTSMGKGYEVRGDTQKPDYGTRYMLEELGNLKSDGAGIANLDSKLSIGLSANQQMTMVFQGMKQISSVYGDEMYDIVKDNVGTINYNLSRNDDSLDYISGMTGKTHRIDFASQGISETIGSIDKSDNSINLTKQKTEVPVISKEQLANLTDGESVVITPTRRRDNMNRVSRTNPIFNTREQLMPFAFAMFGGQGKATEASGQGTAETASTIYSTVDANPDEMVPDFKHILRVTVRQAMYYVKHRSMLESKFKDPKLRPLGSEALSEAIMDYINYDVDINRDLINEGLAAYMMLTPEEIVTAAHRQDVKGIDRKIGITMLQQQGFTEEDAMTEMAGGEGVVRTQVDVNETSEPVEPTVSMPKIQSVSFLGGEITSRKDLDAVFDKIADSEDELSNELVELFMDEDNWDTSEIMITGRSEKKVLQVVLPDGGPAQDVFEVSNDGSARKYHSNRGFQDLFLDEQVDEPFVDHDILQKLIDYANEDTASEDSYYEDEEPGFGGM